MCPTHEKGVAWDLRELGTAQGEETREGWAPQARKEISNQHPAKKISSQPPTKEISSQPLTKEVSSQPPARKEATWRRRRKKRRVRRDEGEPACTE
jgi:hypothetical protein